MQKRNSHVRKSHYHPPKPQTEKQVRETVSGNRSKNQNVKSVSRNSSRSASVKKSASPHKGMPSRNLPAKHPAPMRFIFWKKSRKKLLSLRSAVLLLVICLLGGTGIHFAYKLGIQVFLAAIKSRQKPCLIKKKSFLKCRKQKK